MILNDPIVAKAVAVVKQALLAMKGDKRLEVFDEITDGYCKHCGDEIGPGNPCYCWKDD